VKNGYAQKYRETVWGIRAVSPEVEKKGYGGFQAQNERVEG